MTDTLTYLVPWTQELEERYFPKEQIRPCMQDSWDAWLHGATSTPDTAYPAHMADIIISDAHRDHEAMLLTKRVRSFLQDHAA